MNDFLRASFLLLQYIKDRSLMSLFSIAESFLDPCSNHIMNVSSVNLYKIYNNNKNNKNNFFNVQSDTPLNH